MTAIVPITPLPGQTRDPRFSEVTILRLLQHLGGWDRDRTFDPMFYDRPIQAALQTSLPIRQEHIVTFMAGQRIDYPPGSTHVYSNFGYLLLGRVIEAVAKMPYAAATRAVVLTRPRIGRMRLVLTYQADGNLALYDTQGGALWASGTRGPAGQVVMQADGNLMISDARGVEEWASNTGGNPGAYALVTDDGNLVIYSADDRVIWRCRP